ncbi:unnamed protein product [Penicillium crustosum]
MSYAPPYGDPYARPPPDRPPYDPYGRPPADPYARPPQDGYDRPPYDGGRPAYDRGPYSAPPPLARPPPGPPPPLPQGWVQEWEPSARRAFYIEQATGRSQWEAPYQQPGYSGYNDGSRSVPPPEPQGGYYAPPPGPPPVPYDNRGPSQDYYQQPEPEKKSSNAGKYLAAGAAGLAVGGLGGALIAHELGEDSDKSDLEEAYEQGRRDEEEAQSDHSDGGW